jgi:hypothetical protein
MSSVVQILLGMAMKLLTSAALEELLVFVARKAAAHTETKADDELVAIIEKHLGR